MRLAGVAGLALLAVGALPVQADDSFQPVNPPLCSTLGSRVSGPLYEVAFDGIRVTMWDMIERYWADGCFGTERECKIWLNQVQGAFPQNNFRPCRRIR